MSVTATRAPDAPSARATASPIPPAAPVTIATARECPLVPLALPSRAGGPVRGAKVEAYETDRRTLHCFHCSAVRMRRRPARGSAEITVGYGIGAEVLPVFVAKDRGYLDKHGLDVTLVAIAGRRTFRRRCSRTRFRSASTRRKSALGGRQRSRPDHHCGNTRVVRGNETNTLVARTGSGIHSAADLKARSGRAGFGTGNDTMFRRWLTERKVSPIN